MKHSCTVAILLAIGMAAGSWADDGKLPSIEEIMSRAHKKNKLRDQLSADLQRPAPDWAGVQKKTREFATLASALSKNEPPKGEKASWQRLSTEYADAVKLLDAAAAKQDAKAALAANKKLGTKCVDCHKVHRE